MLNFTLWTFICLVMITAGSINLSQSKSSTMSVQSLWDRKKYIDALQQARTFSDPIEAPKTLCSLLLSEAIDHGETTLSWWFVVNQTYILMILIKWIFPQMIWVFRLVVKWCIEDGSLPPTRKTKSDICDDQFACFKNKPINTHYS